MAETERKGDRERGGEGRERKRRERQSIILERIHEHKFKYNINHISQNFRKC